MIAHASTAAFTRLFILLTAACLAVSGVGCASQTAEYHGQRVFNQPEEAAAQLAAATAAGSAADLEAIFGTQAREVLSSGDPVADRHSREVVAVAMSEVWKLEPEDSNTRELIIGYEAWPFPIPLVRDERGWWFDTAAGAEEIRMRRIGRNELATIRSLHTYVVAQHEYAAVGRDGNPAGVFAQRIRSSPGKRDGLYWPVTATQKDASPLGEHVAAATAEGYGQSAEGTAPFRGYYYRILKSQGDAAPGGPKNYVINGNMTGGFAMVAYPAEYGSSGVMTFLVGPSGAVYERDLGTATANVARDIEAFNPAPNWRVVD
jgi:hypothetical protein